jgi:hypothetical protein
LFISQGEIKVIHKVRKRQHQNPEFDHKQGEIHPEFGYKRVKFTFSLVINGVTFMKSKVDATLQKLLINTL